MSGLTREECIRILKLKDSRATRLVVEDALAIYNLLNQEEPFYGTVKDIANELNIQYYRAQYAISFTKEDHWVHGVGWSIAYAERKGPGPKLWVTTDSVEYITNHQRLIYREHDLLGNLKRVQSQVDLINVEEIDPEDRKMNRFVAMCIRMAVEALEMEAA